MILMSWKTATKTNQTSKAEFPVDFPSESDIIFIGLPETGIVKNGSFSPSVEGGYFYFYRRKCND